MDGQKADISDESFQRLVRLFCLIITKNPDCVKEVADTCKKDPSLLTRPLTFLCGKIKAFKDTGCACASDHECFAYVSENKLVESRFNEIVKSIESGKCIHYESLLLPRTSGRYGDKHWFPQYVSSQESTSVNLILAAAAVGDVQTLKLLLRIPEEKPALSRSMHLSPLHVAMILEQRESVETIILGHDGKLERYCKDLEYRLRNNIHNVINFFKLSTLEFFLKNDDFKTAECLLKHTRLKKNWAMAAFKSGTESALNLVLPYIDEKFVGKLLYWETRLFLLVSIERGLTEISNALLKHYDKKGWTRRDTATLALLATVMNRSQILQFILQMDFKANEKGYLDYTLLDISILLAHSECSNVLQAHGALPTRTPSSPILLMLEIGYNIPHHSERITGMLVTKVGQRHSVKQEMKDKESMLLYSLKYYGGLGARALLALGDDVEAADEDGLNALTMAMNRNNYPRRLFDILYYNPEMKICLGKNIATSTGRIHLFNRTTASVSILAVAIERDVENYYFLNRCVSSDSTSFVQVNEGLISILLIDCGYNVRKDHLVKASYKKWLTTVENPATEKWMRGIKARILQRIERELFYPKPLIERCRDVLRRELNGHTLHSYLSSAEVPTSVRDYILMEKRLEQKIVGE